MSADAHMPALRDHRPTHSRNDVALAHCPLDPGSTREPCCCMFGKATFGYFREHVCQASEPELLEQDANVAAIVQFEEIDLNTKVAPAQRSEC